MNALLSRNSPSVRSGPAPSTARKFRLRNATQALAAVTATLAGADTFAAMMADKAYAAYLRRAVFDEIATSIALPEADKRELANEFLEELHGTLATEQPMMQDPLTHWRSSVLPALQDYHRSRGLIPPALGFSLAAAIALHRPAAIGDDQAKSASRAALKPSQESTAAATFLADAWRDAEVNGDWYAFAYTVLRQDTIWGQDLTRMRAMVGTIAQHLATIVTSGGRLALDSLNSAQP
jgi:tagaturonate reductase